MTRDRTATGASLLGALVKRLRPHERSGAMNVSAESDPLQTLLDRAHARRRPDPLEEITSVVLLGIDAGGRVRMLDQRNKVWPANDSADSRRGPRESPTP